MAGMIDPSTTHSRRRRAPGTARRDRRGITVGPIGAVPQRCCDVDQNASRASYPEPASSWASSAPALEGGDVVAARCRSDARSRGATSGSADTSVTLPRTAGCISVDAEVRPVGRVVAAPAVIAPKPVV